MLGASEIALQVRHTVPNQRPVLVPQNPMHAVGGMKSQKLCTGLHTYSVTHACTHTPPTHIHPHTANK